MHTCVISFPKVDKHTLGQQLQTKTLQLIETIFLASRQTVDTKKGTLLESNSQLDLLKLLVRMSADIKALNQKKYMLLQRMLQEVGKMLGGWLRSLD
ncbi:MAG: four helix bundle protein [Candidatus Berkelbacteria bacterium]|nr:four helix bundle protein [Candidatus Berkelbacteria bacterium]